MKICRLLCFLILLVSIGRSFAADPAKPKIAIPGTSIGRAILLPQISGNDHIRGKSKKPFSVATLSSPLAILSEYEIVADLTQVDIKKNRFNLYFYDSVSKKIHYTIMNRVGFGSVKVYTGGFYLFAKKMGFFYPLFFSVSGQFDYTIYTYKPHIYAGQAKGKTGRRRIHMILKPSHHAVNRDPKRGIGFIEKLQVDLLTKQDKRDRKKKGYRIAELKSEKFLKKRRLKKSAKEIEKLIQRYSPWNLDLYFKHGILLCRAKRTDHGIRELEKASVHTLLRARTWYHQGVCEFQRKDYARSTKLFNRAMKEHEEGNSTLRPEDILMIRFMFGVVEYGRKNFKVARDNFEYVVLSGVAKGDLLRKSKKYIHAINAYFKHQQVKSKFISLSVNVYPILFDSNVVSLPDSVELVSDKAGMSSGMDLDFSLEYATKKSYRGSVGLDYSMSYHFDSNLFIYDIWKYGVNAPQEFRFFRRSGMSRLTLTPVGATYFTETGTSYRFPPRTRILDEFGLKSRFDRMAGRKSSWSLEFDGYYKNSLLATSEEENESGGKGYLEWSYSWILREKPLGMMSAGAISNFAFTTGVNQRFYSAGGFFAWLQPLFWKINFNLLAMGEWKHYFSHSSNRMEGDFLVSFEFKKSFTRFLAFSVMSYAQKNICNVTAYDYWKYVARFGIHFTY